MAVKNIAQNSWSCFSQNFVGLVRTTAPYIGVSLALTLLSSILPPDTNMVVTFAVGLLDLLARALITLSGLKFLYALDDTVLGIDGKKTFFYIIAMLYIGIAVGLGFLFFVIPGIIIMVVTFLAPVFILKDSNGPIEAVASSVSLIKEELLAVTLFLGAIFLAIFSVQYMGSYLLGLLLIPELLVNGLSETASLVIWLYTLPVMKFMYSDLGGDGSEVFGASLES